MTELFLILYLLDKLCQKMPRRRIGEFCRLPFFFHYCRKSDQSLTQRSHGDVLRALLNSYRRWVRNRAATSLLQKSLRTHLRSLSGSQDRRMNALLVQNCLACHKRQCWRCNSWDWRRIDGRETRRTFGRGQMPGVFPLEGSRNFLNEMRGHDMDLARTSVDERLLAEKINDAWDATRIEVNRIHGIRLEHELIFGSAHLQSVPNIIEGFVAIERRRLATGRYPL